MNDLKEKTALVPGSTSGSARPRPSRSRPEGPRAGDPGLNEQRAAGVVAETESGGGTAA
jgi:hypothetical protein